MTIPRELALFEMNGSIYVKSSPVSELLSLKKKGVGEKSKVLPGQYLMKINADTQSDFSITLSNKNDERLVVGFDKAKDQYFIDRTKSGKTNFSSNFSRIAYAPRLAKTASSTLLLLVDGSSVEVFADGGKTVMTSIFFPTAPDSDFALRSAKETQLIPLNSIW